MNQPHVDRQVGHLLAAHLTAGPRPLVHGLDVFPLVCPVGEGGGAARDVAEQPLPFAVHDAHMLGQLFHLHQVEGGLQSLKIWDGFGSGFKIFYKTVFRSKALLLKVNFSFIR